MKKKDYIEIEGARVHNLKNISLKIPHNELVVLTGLSGSGKSSLAFDTIFAEGQRRYVESLSAYARQFLGRITKPEVDKIKGISPAIAIEQKVTARNPRSTVGTSTEIYDYLKLLFAKVGRIYSPITGKEVKIDTVEDVVDFVVSLDEGSKIIIAAPFKYDSLSSFIDKITSLFSEGYNRFWYDGAIVESEDLIKNKENISGDIFILLDRMKTSKDRSDDMVMRISEGVENAFRLSDGACVIISDFMSSTPRYDYFSNSLFADGISYELPTEHLFNFNTPLGACPECQGYGKIVGIDEALVIQDPTKTIFEDAVMCWRGETMKWWKEQVINSAAESGFPIHKPYYQLTDNQRRDLWSGCKYFLGIDDFFASLEKEKYKIQYRVIISRYTGKRVCTVCKGSRLRKEASYIKVGGYNITELTSISQKQLYTKIDDIYKNLSDHDKSIAERIFKEIKARVGYLLDLGLEYLTLDRLSNTLSGGESQRINLSTSLGSSLVGSMYILDEPSIGLHPRDTERLISVLKKLRDIGNSVIVVEHDADIMKASDHIIDIGKYAGVNGGEVVFQGSYKNLLKEGSKSITAQFLSGKEKIVRSETKRKLTKFIEIKGARENNLKNIDVKIPLKALTCVTGVSGSGKSSLVKKILYPILHRHFTDTGGVIHNYESFSGDISYLKGVELVDQNPIGRSSRSNPVTYIKAYDEIRKLFAEQPLAKANGYTSSHFSFNIVGGRCNECEGEGVIRVGMQFMADIEMTCESCGGRRFKDEILQIKYKDHSIDQILDMSVDEAISFFKTADKNSYCNKIIDKLSTLNKVGLGYVKLGQASSTLSGGESQRVKLASFLQKENAVQPILFIFDEPTTGLHFYDIKKLMHSFNSLIDKGHTIVVVEHNMDVIRNADYIIDLGKDGGDNGGELIYQGDIESFKDCADSYTAKYL